MKFVLIGLTSVLKQNEASLFKSSHCLGDEKQLWPQISLQTNLNQAKLLTRIHCNMQILSELDQREHSSVFHKAGERKHIPK